MIVNPFTGVVSSTLSGSKNTLSRVEKAIAQLASGEALTRAADDVANLSIATQLQSRSIGLRSAIGNFSQAQALSRVAGGGVDQIQEALDRMRQLATQASSGIVDDAARKALDVEFQQLQTQIDDIATSTSFAGKSLLDGSVAQADALSLSGLLGEIEGEESATLSIPSLKVESLFGSRQNIAEREDAQAALEAIQQAANTVGTVRAGIGSFEETVDVAAASLESALFNFDAASSLLSDTDFADAATGLSQALLQQEAAVTIQAQTRRLPPSMLELIG